MTVAGASHLGPKQLAAEGMVFWALDQANATNLSHVRLVSDFSLVGPARPCMMESKCSVMHRLEAFNPKHSMI